jgi:DNA-binding IclR family transcriptional regulator
MRGMQVDGNGIQVITRAAAIIRSLEAQPNGLSLSEIAARVALPRSTVQRIVATLVEERLLMAASARARVRLGPALVQLGAAADVGTEKVARPFMQELSRLVEETVDLSVLRQDRAVFVEQVQGVQRLVAVSAVGREFPLHCTANGKALLALMDAGRRERLLPARLKRHTAATETDRSALLADLAKVERSGVSLDLQEHSEGICAVGAAFVDPIGREYSLSIPVPASRFEGKRALLVRQLKKTKAELVAQLFGE